MYERFSMYRFAIDYPNTWRVEFGPKSGRADGYVIFRSSSNQRVFLSWGMLEKIRNKYDSLEAQAKASLAKIMRNRNVRRVNLMEEGARVVNGHEAVLKHFSVERAIGMLVLNVDVREIWSVHLRCEETGRFFVVYESVMLSSRRQRQSTVFNHMVDSFVCH